MNKAQKELTQKYMKVLMQLDRAYQLKEITLEELQNKKSQLDQSLHKGMAQLKTKRRLWQRLLKR